MPYIDKDIKARLDRTGVAKGVGELTYLVTKQLINYLQNGNSGLSYHYADIAECLGALEGAKADLIERVLKPYEEKARKRNGDVWPKDLVTFVDPPNPLKHDDTHRVIKSSTGMYADCQDCNWSYEYD